LKIVSSQRGVGLVDAIITLFLLGIAGAVFSAMYPTGIKASRQAHQYKVAASIAQRKMEQVRAMPYESITPVGLMAGSIIDQDDDDSPYSFTSVDGVADQLVSGTGSLSVSELSSGVKWVRVSVSWDGPPGSPDRTITLTTLCADKRPRRVN